MKLQIEGQQLRLRVDESELKQLQDGDVLCGTTLFAGGESTFNIMVQLVSLASIAIEPCTWRFELPMAAVNEYAARLPCREGLELGFSAGLAATFNLIFEVDVRDSIRKRGAARRLH